MLELRETLTIKLENKDGSIMPRNTPLNMPLPIEPSSKPRERLELKEDFSSPLNPRLPSLLELEVLTT